MKLQLLICHTYHNCSLTNSCYVYSSIAGRPTTAFYFLGPNAANNPLPSSVQSTNSIASPIFKAFAFQ